MQIVFHIGAHATDNGKLLKSLFRNKGALAGHGVVVSGPGRYRKLLQDTLVRLGDAAPDPEARDILLDAILEDSTPDRVILSNDNFLCFPGQVLTQQILYASTTHRIMQLGRLFPEDQLEFFLALRNPAGFLPAVHRLTRKFTFEQFLRNTNPLHLRWSHMVRRIREASPDAVLTVWCNEDTPLVWDRLLHELTATDFRFDLKGSFDLLEEIMTREGLQHMKTFLQNKPPRNALRKQRIIETFLEKYARLEAIEEELEAPGWTEDLVARLTENYDRDVAEIQQMEGVRLIRP